MKSSGPATPGRRGARGEFLSRAEEAGRKARGRPLLEGPGLVMWIVVVDALLVHIVWLLTHMTYVQATLLHMSLLSLVTLLFFGLDKWRAHRDQRRVSEANLLALSLVGGAAGGLVGMALFRHKINRLRFRIVLPFALFLHVAVVLVINFTDL